MTPDDDWQAGAGRASRVLGQLQADGAEHYRIVRLHGAFLLVTQDLVEIDGGQPDERTGRIGRRAAELGIVLRQVALVQVAVGGPEIANAGQAQSVHDATL
jgi:hypothetical protein